MLPFLAVLGVIGWPRSSKMRPIRRAAEAARLTLAPLRLAVSFSWTASNRARLTIAACSPGIARPLVVQLTEIDPVAQDMGERPIGQRHAADRAAGAEGAAPCHH